MLCSVLQPFTGFMTSVMIFTNVWFDGLLSVTRGDSDALCRLQNIAGERILWTRGWRRRAISTVRRSPGPLKQLLAQPPTHPTELSTFSVIRA